MSNFFPMISDAIMNLDFVEWSRIHFGMTAAFHFLFVPLTLGLSFMIAFFESFYYASKNEVWKKITKFWMTLFAINFVIGAATGIILEFEFGANWANFSWTVGDIFGAPLAVEGIVAFFLETTFFVVMLFGWERVSNRFHLFSTWMVALGSSLSAFWILVANGWMQHPVGTHFNVSSGRSEMINFWDVALSPVGVSKFLHTLASSYIISALFVTGVSAWLILKNKNLFMARRSLIVGASFGFFASIFTIFTGDDAAYRVAQYQPVKLAAIEGLYEGQSRAGIIAFGVLNPEKKFGDDKKDFLFKFELPAALSLLGQHDINAFVPGMTDLVYGNKEQKIMSVQEKINMGQVALKAQKEYKLAEKNHDQPAMNLAKKTFDENVKYFGYAALKNPVDVIPNIPVTFYSFHLMVALGMYFLVLFIVSLYLGMVNEVIHHRKFLWLLVWSIPLGYLASELGWIVAEMGRQPWAIQDLLLTNKAASNLNAATVQTTLVIFFLLFTTLLVANISILIRKIRKGMDS